MKYALDDLRVQTDGDDYWIAPNAAVIGDVTMKKNASVWWNSVIRGDNEPIVLGENTQVQDGCVLHTDPGFPTILGDNVSIGHMAMLHGCTIADNTLIAIGCVILNGVTVGSNCIIGANSFIPEGKEIPDNSLVFGSPAKVIREVDDDHIEMIRFTWDHYVHRWQRYKRELREDGV
jgi:carbonic anhydrase/acetyltransferase-like protein (isoleucine patch superfamily)